MFHAGRISRHSRHPAEFYHSRGIKEKNQKPITQRTDLSQENLDTMAQTATLIVVITTVTNRKTSPFYPPVNFLIYATRSSRILAPWIICANLQIPNTTP